jgi:hypothetical protein
MAGVPLTERLLLELEQAQAALIQQPGAAGRGVSAGLRAVHLAVSGAVSATDESGLLWSPAPVEWCIAEVLEHMVEHDRAYAELEQHGGTHYVEHGLEHALQVWSLLRDYAAATSPSGTLR